MAIDLDTILRRLDTRQPNLGVNTNPASGSGLTGLSPSGGGGVSGPAPSGLQTGYTPGGLNLGGNGGGNQGGGLPNYNNIDDFGFDQMYSQGMDSIARRLADAQSQYDLSNQRDQEDYDRAIHDTQEQQGLDVSALLDRMANQGMLRSGIQVKAQSDLADSYQRRLADYERAFTDGRSNRDREWAQFQQGLNDEKAGLQQERTRRQQLAEQEAARQRAQQAQQNQLGQYVMPNGMSTDMFRDPNNTELQSNYHQILNGNPVGGAGDATGQDPNAPGAGDAYASWDQPQSAVQAYLQAVYNQEQLAVQNYLNALYAQQSGIPG